MDVSQDKDKAVRRFVRWLKDKVENRRGRDGDTDPWWVTLLLDVGRPVVAVMILTMCAPGEHYLAVQAGWSRTLAWGMPGTLTAYAGIAAVVATKRPKSAPGRSTAVAGAIVSVGLAMAAQPVAHLYGRTGLSLQLVVLTCVMGIVPAAVFGHLLHMGASGPKPVRPASGQPRTSRPSSSPAVSGPVRTAPDKGASLSPDGPGQGARTILGPSPDRPRTAPDELGSRRDLTEFVRSLRTGGLDEPEIKDRVRDEIPDVKADSLNKAIRRTRTA